MTHRYSPDRGIRRTVVTGIGLISPLGIGTEETWVGLSEGRSGIETIKAFDASRLPVRIAGEVKGFVPEQYIRNRKTLKVLSRSDSLGMAAATMAWQDAGLGECQFDGARTGLYVACGKEPAPADGLGEAVAACREANGDFNYRRLGESSVSLVSPLFFLEGLPITCLFYLSEMLGIYGPNLNLVGSGDAGAQAIGQAFRAIRRGEVDLALAGGYDCCCDWWNLCKHAGLGSTSRRNEDPSRACRPFDQTRDGTVLGEGAAFVVLEARSQALQRRAPIYAEMVGYGAGCDAFNVIKPHPEGRGLAIALRAALEDAGLEPADIDYISAHGSGTVLGDRTETAGIKSALGSHASRVPVSSIKSMIGDLGAAAGAIGFAAALLALQSQLIPPTINYQYPDPSCDLDTVPNKARKTALSVVIAVGRGQGGQNAVLIAKGPEV